MFAVAPAQDGERPLIDHDGGISQEQGNTTVLQVTMEWM